MCGRKVNKKRDDTGNIGSHEINIDIILFFKCNFKSFYDYNQLILLKLRHIIDLSLVFEIYDIVTKITLLLYKWKYFPRSLHTRHFHKFSRKKQTPCWACVFDRLRHGWRARPHGWGSSKIQITINVFCTLKE